MFIRNWLLNRKYKEYRILKRTDFSKEDKEAEKCSKEK